MLQKYKELEQLVSDFWGSNDDWDDACKILIYIEDDMEMWDDNDDFVPSSNLNKDQNQYVLDVYNSFEKICKLVWRP